MSFERSKLREKDKNDVKRKRQMTIHDMFAKSQK